MKVCEELVDFDAFDMIKVFDVFSDSQEPDDTLMAYYTITSMDMPKEVKVERLQALKPLGQGGVWIFDQDNFLDEEGCDRDISFIDTQTLRDLTRLISQLPYEQYDMC